MSSRRYRATIGLLSLLVVAAFTVSVGWGAVSIAPAQVAAVLLDKAGVSVGVEVPPLQASVLWSIRVPRSLMALFVGGGLAVAGVALQGVFRNPLAEPSLLGISGGAVAASMLATVVRSSLGLSTAPGWSGPAAGFIGALLVALALHSFFRRSPGRDVTTLVLTGVIANVVLGAVITLLPAMFRGGGLGSDAAFWTMGGLGGTLWPAVHAVAPVTVVAALLLWRAAPELNLIALGDADAEHLGVDTDAVRRRSVVLVALLTGAASAFVGIIAFVGLLVPHGLRLLLGPDHRRLLPAAALGGALMVTAADVAARSLVSPAELPVGVLTTLLGGPLFFWLLHRARKRWV